MVTLGSIQPTNFQTFHGARAYDDTLNFRSFELALNDVPDANTSSEDIDSSEERTLERPKTSQRGPMSSLAPADRPVLADEAAAVAAAARFGSRLTPPQNSSASDRPHPSQLEPKSWHPHPVASDDAMSLSRSMLGREDRGFDSRLRASSWHAADMRSRSSPTLSNGSTPHQHQVSCFSPRSPKHDAKSVKEEDKPSNEVINRDTQCQIASCFLGSRFFLSAPIEGKVDVVHQNHTRTSAQGSLSVRISIVLVRRWHT